MKIHTPLFILGLLVFITPAIGFPQLYEQIILAAYGVAIMLLVSTNNVLEKVKNKKSNSEHDSAVAGSAENSADNQKENYEETKTF